MIKPINRTQTCSTTPGQSGPESNSSEEVLHISQNSRNRASPSDRLMSYFQSWFETIHGNKWSTKGQKGSQHWRLLSERIITCHSFRQSQRQLTHYQPTPQPTNSPAFPPQDQDCSLSTDSGHTTAQQVNKPAKNNLHPLTSWPLSGGRRESVSFLIYRLYLK